jgi:hypothetical protein
MPRSVHKIIDFSGGLSDDSDPRDLNDNELASAKDINVAKIGKIVMMGVPSVITSPNWDSAIGTAVAQYAAIGNVTIGYGTSIFTSDYHVTGSSGNKNFLAISGLSTTGSTVTSSKKYFVSRIWEDDGIAWPGGTIIINSNTNQTAVSITNTTYAFKPNYYYADGALRICDGNFSNTSSVNKWFGYIKRNHFGDNDVYNDYYEKTNNLAAPTRGVFTKAGFGNCAAGGSGTLLESDNASAFTDGGSVLDTELDTGVYSVHHIQSDQVVGLVTRTDNNTLVTEALSGTTVWATNEDYAVLPPAGTGFNLTINSTGSAGSWTAGDYEFASSFIYDDEQESKLFELIGDGDAMALSSTESWYMNVMCQGPFDPRIMGGRIYTRIYDSADEWTLLMDIHLNDGWRVSLEDDYTVWHAAWSNDPSWITGNLYSHDPNADTYESLNGISDQGKDITAKYKTAVVTNRMAYIGNVRINGKNFEDSIFKSFVNRFDTFTEDRRIDVAINDGDAIVKLETYADRILEFKKKMVYVINVAQEVEFLENEYKHLGIDYPYQSVNTEFGIVWFNSKGCYLYNGKGVIDLLLDPQDPRRRKIALSTWQDFIGTYPSIGYEAKNKKLMVFAELSGADIDIYLYDFITGSWTLGVDKYDNASANYSNPVTDWDDDLIVFNDNDSEIYKWSNTPATSANFEIKTKDFDGGLPGIKKILYKVIITYKSTGDTATNIQVRYDTNGGTSFPKDFTPKSNATLDGTISELEENSEWAAAVLEPDTDSESHDIYSWALKFFADSGTNVDSGFEINDITYIYRVKGLR